MTVVMSRLTTTALAAALTATPALALAHIQLASPAQRITSQKAGPCGAAGSVRGTNVTVFEPGAMVTLTWNETINHPSHYRIAFDADGQDDFLDPPNMNDTFVNAAVLADMLPDNAGGAYEHTVQLPNIECENCTLQLIQVMYDKPPYGDGNDLYYQCADIALRVGGAPAEPDAGASNPADPDAGVGTDPDPDPDPTPGGEVSGGCQSSSTPGVGALMALLGLALGARRKLFLVRNRP